MNDSSGYKVFYEIGAGFIDGLTKCIDKRIEIEQIGRKDAEKFSLFYDKYNKIIFKNYLDEYKEYKRFDEFDILMLLTGLKDILFQFMGSDGGIIDDDKNKKSQNVRNAFWIDFKKLLIGNKKICGILTEAVTNQDKLESVLVGIGIDVNINDEDIPQKLQSVATSVKKETQIELNRAEIIRSFFKIFEELYEEFKKGNFKHIVSEWRRLSSTTGNRVKVYKKGEVLIADAVGITNEGALIVETDEGKLEKITSGECIIINE
jgi:BirA family biotin operon repressor/biotin-[acetyl-CoA-carboxylase] ligase